MQKLLSRGCLMAALTLGVHAHATSAPARNLREPTAPTGDAVSCAPLSFTIESAVARALDANRDLRAAAFIVDEAQGRLDGAGLLPNPELETEFAPGVTSSGAYRVSAGITQRFPLTGRLRLARAVAASEVAAAREEVNAARRDLIAAVKTDAVEALALKARLQLLATSLRLAEEAARSARSQAQDGAQSPIESAYAELALADAAAQSDRTRSDLEATIDKLKARLGFEPGTRIDIEGRLPAAEDAAVSPAAPLPDSTPELRRANILAEGAHTAVKLAEARRTGDLGVGIFGEVERQVGGGPNNPAGFVGVKLSIPLPLWDDNRGEIRSAKARRERIQAELEAERLRVSGAAEAARAEHVRLVALMRPLAEQLLPAARALTTRILEARTRGEVGYAELIRAREKQAELENRLLTLRRDAALAHIRWETAASVHPAIKAE